MSDRPIDDYLNHHLSGATFGYELAQRTADEVRDPALRAPMQQLANDIAADRERLEHVMQRVGTDQNDLMVQGASIIEKVGKVFTGLGSTDNEFGFFEAVETLSLGVEGKRCLWLALREVQDQYPGLSEVDLDELIERATKQREMLEEQRAAAVPRALTAVVGTAVK